MPGFRMIATIATILQSLRSISGKSETLNLNPDLFSFDRCVAAKTGRKPVVKLTSWCQIQSTIMVAVNRQLLLESCYFLVLSIIRRSYIKLLSDFGPEIRFHKHAMLIFVELACCADNQIFALLS